MEKRSCSNSRTHLLVPATTWGLSIFLERGTIVALMAQKRCLFPRGNMQSIVGIRLLPSSPRSRSQTEVVAPLRQCSTVPDVENHVLFTLCTKADSGNASSCSDPAQSDQNCLDPSVNLDAIGIGSSASSSACGRIGICNSHQLSPGVPSASLRRRTNFLPSATVFGCVLFEFCQERKVYL